MPNASAAARRTRVLAAPAPSLCLDFVNTRFWRGSPQPTETLGSVDALSDWLSGAGGVDAATADGLRALPAAAAARYLAEALAAREQLYALLHALATALPMPAAALAALAHQIALAPPRVDLVLTGKAHGWGVRKARPGMADLLAPVWWSAADLTLAVGRLPLRCCANPRCGWLFLDDSKGGTRRWCAMSACGNRAKAQRHAQRRRERDAQRPALVSAPVRPPAKG